MSHHTSDPKCPLCEEKLTQAHEVLVEWYQGIKEKHPTCHISWSYRGKEDQERAYADHKTRAHYPQSPHNNTQDGKPYSLALDLFEIDEDGAARFNPIFYAKINADNEASGAPIVWGGHFKSIGDADHFQVKS